MAADAVAAATVIMILYATHSDAHGVGLFSTSLLGSQQEASQACLAIESDWPSSVCLWPGGRVCLCHQAVLT